MRHYHSRANDSYVLRNKPAAAMQRDIITTFARALDLGSRFYYYAGIEDLTSFVFEGDRDSARRIFDNVTPAEGRAIVEFRIWYKEIEKQIKFRSPRFWTRTSDFVYCNVNSGRGFIAIDGHYWD
jgi:hypothetical protein